MMRGACGSNDHPDSVIFIQTYKLLSTYSLVKPPKGSNIENDELLKTLLNMDEMEFTNDNVTHFRSILDKVMESPVSFSSNSDSEQNMSFTEDHDYNLQSSSPFVIAYLAGYICRKSQQRFTKCDICVKKLKSSEPSKNDKFTELLSKGFLIYPSNALFKLVESMEYVFLESVNKTGINDQLVFTIATNLQKIHLIKIGCEIHCESLTEAVIRFFFVMRMHFLCKQINKIQKHTNEKTIKFRKLSKL